MMPITSDKPSPTRARSQSFQTILRAPRNIRSTSISTHSDTSSNAASVSSSSSAASPLASKRPRGTTSQSLPSPLSSCGYDKCPHDLEYHRYDRRLTARDEFGNG